MSISLQFNPSASDVLNFALSGFPFSNANFYGTSPGRRSALFTNGLAAGFPLDRGALFTSNDIQTTTNPVYENFDGTGGSVGISFELEPKGAQNYKSVQISWCSCDIPGFDFGSLVTPNATAQTFDVNLPDNAPLMPQNQIAGSGDGQLKTCKCRSDSQLFTMGTGGESSMGMSFDRRDNSFFFIGQNNDPDLVTTTTTSYITTITIQETISTDTTTTTTSPFTYSTTTITPVGLTSTITPSVTSTVTLPGATITQTPSVSTVTSTAKPTCTVYDLTFAKDCCPRQMCKKGAPPVIKPPKPTPAPNQNKHPHPQVKSNPKRSLNDLIEFDRRQEPNSLDPPASSTITNGTLFITSFRTSSTPAAEPTTTITTATVTETSTESILASETAGTPAVVTITGNSTSTIQTTFTGLDSTTTLTPITTTYIAAAPCQTNFIPKFFCPKGTKTQQNLIKAEKSFLDNYKRFSCPRAPALAVHCEGDSQVYNY